jgi:hypothetical protein
MRVEAAQFDRWTKLFSQRLSRRSATIGLGAASITSLTSPRWVLGESEATPTVDTIDEPGPDDQEPVDDELSGGDANLQSGFEICQPITRCKEVGSNYSSGFPAYIDVGPIPGGPYPQEWRWTFENGNVPHCFLANGVSYFDLVDLCLQEYPEDKSNPLKPTCGGVNGCAACADIALIGCS